MSNDTFTARGTLHLKGSSGANVFGTLPIESVTLTIGAIPAATTYAASATDQISGLLQVNAVVPKNLIPGPAIPIILTIGNAKSPTTATVAIK
jgi:uncharacterized protein (TIGR03437 family)